MCRLCEGPHRGNVLSAEVMVLGLELRTALQLLPWCHSIMASSIVLTHTATRHLKSGCEVGDQRDRNAGASEESSEGGSPLT